MSDQATIEAAKRYASYGWRVVPVRGKIPIGQGWQKKAAATSEEVETLFSVAHDGVGVLLGEASGIIDLECDSDAAEAELIELFGGDIPPTPTFQSTRGKHRLFQWSSDLPRPALDKAKWMAGSIEVRAGGGAKAAQTVFPPSGERKWIIDPADIPAAELPEIVLARLLVIAAKSERKPELKRTKPVILHAAPSDDRLDVGKWLTNRGVEIFAADQTEQVKRWFIRCPGIDRHTSKDAIRDCVVTQGLSGELGGHCFHSSCGMSDWQALKQAIGAPTWDDYDSGSSALIDVSAIVQQVSEKTIVESMPEVEEKEIVVTGDSCDFPEDCLYPAGTIGQIVRHTLATSMYPQPELALAAAITLLGAYTGRKVADVNETRTNILSLGLAPTGSGKDKARQINKKIIEAAGALDLMGSERIGSHAGIINALDKAPSQIMQIDEMGRILETMKDPRRSPHLFNVITVIMQLYTSSAGTWKADAYADSAKVKMISQPHLCIYGTSTPEAFWQSLTTQNIGDGLIGRLMVFEGRGYELEMHEPKFDPIPSQIIETTKRWLDFQPSGILGSVFPNPVVVKHSPEALLRHYTHLKEISRKRHGEHPLRAAVWSRSGEKSAKLALIHACSRCEGPPDEITIEDAEWGIRLANYLTRRLLKGCQDHIAENDIEARAKRVLAIITADGVTQSEVGRRCQWLRPRDRNEVLSDLMQLGYICAERIGTATKTKTIFRRLK
jgi:hypothetical protein